jgi:DNA polymerase-3 subunit gamma/tau
MDIVEIDAASNRGIDEIRLLRDRIGLTPGQAKYTVYIIDEVHMLTNEAFNALLKTLEEPPVHAVFILATTDPQKIPATIKSRCVHFAFAKAGIGELTKSIERIIKSENIAADQSAVAALTEFADGSFRDAAKLLEQVSFEKGSITGETVRKVLAISDPDQIRKFILAVSGGQLKTAIEMIESVTSTGADIKTFIQQVLEQLEQLLITTFKTDPDNEMINVYKLMIKSVTKAFNDMRFCPIPQLPLEVAVIEFNTSVNPPVKAVPSGTPAPDNKESQINYSGNTSSGKTGGGWSTKKIIPEAAEMTKPPEISVPDVRPAEEAVSLGLISLEKLVECWKDVIEDLNPYNRSVAGVMRSTRPKSVNDGIVTIEAFYKFHLEKLSEIRTKEAISSTLKKLFGERVKVEIVLGKK